MAIIKILLDERRAKDNGTYPVKIRVTHQRKTWYYPIGIYLLPNDWDVKKGLVKSKHPNAKLLNLKLKKQLNELEEKVLRLEFEKPAYTIQDIKALYTTPKESPQQVIQQDIFSFAQQMIEQQKMAGRFGNAQSYQSAINQLQHYTPKTSLSFETINYQFLCAWETQLLANGSKINSVAAYFKAIRVMYNAAIKSDLVEAKYYPFKQYKIKTEKTIQRTLTKAQISQIEQLDLPPNTGIEKARDMFILSFNLLGMNFRDMSLLESNNIHGDRIIYKRQKTHKIYSIKVTPKAAYIFDKYKGLNEPYLLPLIANKYHGNRAKQVSVAKETLKNYNNRYLKKIGAMIGVANLTTYYARYSWANVARKMGYSKDLIAEGLGHEYGNKVTGIYLDNYDLEVIDEMNERVCE